MRISSACFISSYLIIALIFEREAKFEIVVCKNYRWRFKTIYLLGKFGCFCRLPNYFRNTMRLSSSFDPVCSHMLSADDTSGQRVNHS